MPYRLYDLVTHSHTSSTQNFRFVFFFCFGLHCGGKYKIFAEKYSALRQTRVFFYSCFRKLCFGIIFVVVVVNFLYFFILLVGSILAPQLLNNNNRDHQKCIIIDDYYVWLFFIETYPNSISDTQPHSPIRFFFIFFDRTLVCVCVCRAYWHNLGLQTLLNAHSDEIWSTNQRIILLLGSSYRRRRRSYCCCNVRYFPCATFNLLCSKLHSIHIFFPSLCVCVCLCILE